MATVLAFVTSFLTLSWYTTWQNGKGKEEVPGTVLGHRVLCANLVSEWKRFSKVA